MVFDYILIRDEKMLISFFEEFPTKENLSKLELIDWPTNLYLATTSLEDFLKIKASIKNKFVKDIIYWPILRRIEGYWISPFSSRKALLRIFNELKGKKVPIMLDLELPTTRNPLLYITQGVNFCKNKRLINMFIREYSGQIYLAEYYPEGEKQEQILEQFGLHYNTPTVKIIKMVYHSLHDFNKEFIINEIKRGQKSKINNFLLGYGLISPGINQKEPVLSLKRLKEDLLIAKKNKLNEVIIFRLAGLDKNYKKIISEILNSK
ncbi:hypothetical protein COY27_07010 [Candidatus Woesearchaeota archaeon CG_4_10_14_0_2_um_filter_33_13]|nr:MAG: hypothetical protein COY27_07010 [Candidatus Woesearchaeota archaeon CG_4_10_14_0_2_um_filter_33_13]